MIARAQRSCPRKKDFFPHCAALLHSVVDNQFIELDNVGIIAFFFFPNANDDKETSLIINH